MYNIKIIETGAQSNSKICYNILLVKLNNVLPQATGTGAGKIPKTII